MRKPCPSCAEVSAPEIWAYDVNRRVTTDRFSYHRCPRCGLVFLHAIPEDLSQYYPKPYFSIPDSVEELARAAQLEEYKMDIVRSLVVGGRLLEIGPAYGAFAYLAKMSGYDVDAIEMDSECCRFLSETVGIRAYQSIDPVSAMEGLGEYDVIALWHVIEHLPNPWAFLSMVPKHLSPRGILVISTPNPGSLQFRLFKGLWAHLDAPRHLQLIPISLLTSRMNHAGMAMEFATSSDRGGRGWNIFGWKESLAGLSSVPLAREVLRMAGRVVGRMMTPLERRDLVGSAYTVAFRK